MSEPVTLTPATVDEAAEHLRQAQAEQATLLPCGNRSRVRRHSPSARPDRWLSLNRLKALRWLDADDQTCEVEAGMSPAELARNLDEHGLELCVDSPGAADGTLGGLFLSPDVSLLHAAFGPPRDQVLGAEWLLADGTRIRSGARVVKSVAGYDLTRLFLGSRGQLAVCTALTLRLRPKPRSAQWFQTEAISTWRRTISAVARRAVQTAPGAPLYLEYADGDQPPRGGAEAARQEEGEAARAAVLNGFASAPARIALADPSQSIAHLGADWNGLQFAVPTGHPIPGEAGIVPSESDPAWLARIAEACAPGALRLGGTR